MAFALIGIVTMQLGLLKLNAGIGRALEHQALLQRENAALSIENSEMTAGNRIESRAAGIGMTLVPSGALRFLATHGRSDANRGAVALRNHVPSSAGSSAATVEPSSSRGVAEGLQATQGGEAGKSTQANVETSAGTSGSTSAGGETAPAGH